MSIYGSVGYNLKSHLQVGLLLETHTFPNICYNMRLNGASAEEKLRICLLNDKH